MGLNLITQLPASNAMACLLVGFHAWSRFSTPRSVRSQTSRFQYFTSCIMYVLACAALWAVMMLAIKQNPAWLAVLHPAPADPTRLDGLEAPLVAALILTTLLPSVPILHEIDGKILAFFHRMGEIPFGAVRWVQRMDCFDMPESLVEEAKEYIRGSGDLPTALVAEVSTDRDGAPQQYLFTRVLVLYVWLKKYRCRPRFEADFAEDVDAFEKRMKSYFAQCVGHFTVVAQLSTQQLAALPDLAKPFPALSNDAYEDVRLMLARLLLYSNNREAQTADKLRSLGFKVSEQTCVAFPFNVLALNWLGVVSLFAIVAVVTNQGGDTITRRLTIGFLVAINHCVAAAIATLPKQLWPSANPGHDRERPVLAYLMSALVTLAVVFVLSSVVYAIRLNLPHTELLAPFGVQCKWLTLSTLLAMLLAAACDNYVLEEQDPRWLRPAESAGIACCMALVGYFVVKWITPDLNAMHWRTQPQPLMPMILSATIGALFGATIPQWHRQTMRRLRQGRKRSETEPFRPVVVLESESSVRMTGEPAEENGLSVLNTERQVRDRFDQQPSELAWRDGAKVEMTGAAEERQSTARGRMSGML
ncbi:hypothetical protein [Burkholderia ubonensis]|uniref:hypothetical protein n=1 Tax=Burkholderia ubonensis TaxID=101571 RepID=UPI000A8A90EE|nr:hypothetical protein [Burkholderia ubonensis]